MTESGPSRCAGVRLAWLALLAPWLVTAPASAQPDVIEGVAALIGASAPGPGVDVVYHSDVELRARMHLAGRAEGPPSVGPLPGALLRATLEELVNEALIAREATRVQVAAPRPRDVEEARARLAAMAGGAERLGALLRALGFPARILEPAVQRAALVAVFLEAHVGSATHLTDADVARAYEAGDHPFVGSPLPEVRDALRAFLVRREIERSVAHWVSVLRARTVLRIVASYGG